MEKELKALIDPYKGNYIMKMRETVGHAPLVTAACGVIIENAKGEILLQQRRDNGKWGIPGGAMEIGEKFIDAAKREVLEEAGIEVSDLTLFGIFSGEDRIVVYPNEDVCCVISIVFKATVYQGEILQETSETLGHAFFSRECLPDDINKYDMEYLNAWKQNTPDIIIR
jgi:8-oxo-dGTP pyrophosphatase MutT (NUDIX family)